MKTRTKWIVIVAEILLIYSTLYIIRFITTFLSERGMLSLTIYVITAVFFLLAALYVLRLRPHIFRILLLIPVFGTYGVLFLKMKIPVERIHLLEYGLLGFMLSSALSDRWDGKKAACVALAAAAAAGYVDEAIQYFLPNRVYDLRDVGFNALAGFGGIAAFAALHWMKSGRNGC